MPWGGDPGVESFFALSEVLQIALIGCGGVQADSVALGRPIDGTAAIAVDHKGDLNYCLGDYNGSAPMRRSGNQGFGPSETNKTSTHYAPKSAPMGRSLGNKNSTLSALVPSRRTGNQICSFTYYASLLMGTIHHGSRVRNALAPPKRSTPSAGTHKGGYGRDQFSKGLRI